MIREQIICIQMPRFIEELLGGEAEWLVIRFEPDRPPPEQTSFYLLGIDVIAGENASLQIAGEMGEQGKRFRIVIGNLTAGFRSCPAIVSIRHLFSTGYLFGNDQQALEATRKLLSHLRGNPRFEIVLPAPDDPWAHQMEDRIVRYLALFLTLQSGLPIHIIRLQTLADFIGAAVALARREWEEGFELARRAGDSVRYRKWDGRWRGWRP